MPLDLDHLAPLHHRAYDVHSYRVSDSVIKVVGSVVDQKPPGLYVPDDSEPLTIHHMQVAIDVDVTTMQIVAADVSFEMHPNESCPSIIEHYEKLVGLSVARGFSRAVRELFGGPRACTHTTALIQAMAPVVIQSLWSLRIASRRERGEQPMSGGAESDAESTLRANLNTCHVWAEDGETVARVRRGEFGEVPIWIARRYAELGRDPEDWRRNMAST